MGKYFGTDGIRGIINKDLTFDIAYKCGNALGSATNKPTIVIGGDTRLTRSYITNAFAGGAMSAGANIIDVGICPTPCIAHITRSIKADFGVVISASHNPAHHNGIKIFNNQGFKLGDKNEEALEQKFEQNIIESYGNVGTYVQNFGLVKLYEQQIANYCNTPLNNLTIVIDGSNGASYKIAPKVFKRLGAKVITINCKNNGTHINDNCGALYPESLAKAIIKHKANIGFAYDGDADRIIACDEKGNIVDGDLIIYCLAKHLHAQGKLTNNTVAVTNHTNMGIEKALNNMGINVIRTDIGDKYVSEQIEKDRLSLGGEKSGHIILRECATSGDGILTSIKLAELVKINNQKLSELCDVEMYPQININCIVSHKTEIMASQELKLEINRQEQIMQNTGRIMVRVSGTESKIRIMCEGKNKEICLACAQALEKIVKQIDSLHAK